jgi:hypothetical protein
MPNDRLIVRAQNITLGLDCRIQDKSRARDSVVLVLELVMAIKNEEVYELEACNVVANCPDD